MNEISVRLNGDSESHNNKAGLARRDIKLDHPDMI